MLDLNVSLILIIFLLGFTYFYIIGDTILYLAKQPFRNYFAPIVGYVFRLLTSIYGRSIVKEY